MSEPLTIKLKSSDDEVFDVETDVVKLSVTLRTMLEDLGAEDDDVIPLPNVNSAILKKVIEWGRYHVNDHTPTEDDNANEKNSDVGPWDQEFVGVDQLTIFELILAANYLDIQGLLDLCCKTVANMIKGKTPEQIRDHFGIEAPSDNDVVNDKEGCSANI